MPSILTPIKNFRQGALLDAFRNATLPTVNEDKKENENKEQNGIQNGEMNGNVASPYDDDDDDDKPKLYEPGLFNKFINYLFCRPDLAKKKLTARPVTIVGLVSNFSQEL